MFFACLCSAFAFISIDWSAVVVDEAHKIKNPNAQITQAMKDLKCEVRWLCIQKLHRCTFKYAVTH